MQVDRRECGRSARLRARSWFLPMSVTPTPTKSAIATRAGPSCRKEREGMRAWCRCGTSTCIFCHNTVPYLSTRRSARSRATARRYQGEVLDRAPARLAMRPVQSTPSRISALQDERDVEMKRRSAVGGSEDLPVEFARSPGGTRHHEEPIPWRITSSRLALAASPVISAAAEHVATLRHEAALSGAAFGPLRVATVQARAVRAKRRRSIASCARCHQVLFSGYDRGRGKAGVAPTKVPGGRLAHQLGGGARPHARRLRVRHACTCVRLP